MGPCSDFSKPCQGAAEKSANTTRKALTVRFCCGFHPLGMSTGEPSAAVQNSGFFYLAGCPVGLEQDGSDASAAEQPTAQWAVGSLRVPISRNVYQDKCCADALHRRFFYLVGYPSGTRTARHYFLLKKHVQNTSGRNGSCVLCTCFLLFDIHPHGQRLICCRICAISALE